MRPVCADRSPLANHSGGGTMKRISRFLALCLVMLFLPACGTEQEPASTVTSFPQANFNNNYWFSGDFWAFDDTLFYLQDGFYNMGAYWSINGNNRKLFEESDFLSDSTKETTIGDIFPFGNYLYFVLYTDQQDAFYRYDLSENTYTEVCEVPFLYRWVVVDDYFIYREHPSGNDEKRSPLCIYNMTDGSTTEACPDVEEFGIVNGELRYITNTDAYELYRYDYRENRATILGTFYCEFDAAYDLFNFTPGGIVMLNWSKEYRNSMAVYSIASNSTVVYTMPKGINQLVACDQYAYAVVYDTQKNSSAAVAAGENGIYRINLTDGSYEVVERNASEDTEIHVTSDDRIYIIQRKTGFLYRSRRHVYKFDYKTGSKKKLTVI